MNVKAWIDENISGKINKSFFTKKKIIIIIASALVLSLMLFFIFGGKKSDKSAEQTYLEVQATKMDISETIEQSGVVEPYERYEITSLVKGEIITSPFEEGDHVEEGDTLYQIDDEDAQLNIEKTQNSIERSQMTLDETNKNIAKLNIYATASGKLTNFNLKMGDSVGNGAIGTIINTERLAVNIPFASNDFEKISVGNSVTITSALYMTSLTGVVTHKYDASAGSGSDGSVLKNIEVEIDNPGALAEGTTFAATVHTNYGDVSSAGSGTIGGGTETIVKAEVNGTVSYIAVKDGDYVKKGQLLARLTSDSLLNTQKSNQLSLKDSQLSLKSSQKTLENYNITAPISGTIITKNSKAGDKLDNSNSTTVMMVVADMSKMKFTISIDELDISSVKIGQKAVVNADALPEERFEAKVTSISSEGTSSGDGVTVFTVELTIDEPGNLKSGMNVNANILVNEAENVVAIPEEALMSVKGSTASVLVKTDKKTENKNERPTQNTKKEADSKEMSAKGVKDFEGAPNRKNNIPEGYEIRMVEVGISNGSYIEIISGISEGETVAYIPSSTGSGNPFMAMMGQMHGGMMGGGMPTGGGGMPSGGVNRR